MKILTVVGARPQFIKAALVSKKLRSYSQQKEILVHTGQHYDSNMSEQFFQEMEIPKPDYNLGIGSGNHGWQTGKMLMELETVLLAEKPDWVLVYGDTNSTLAGAIAAAKLHIPIAHVEAGLRSFNRKMPEEINRLLSDSVSDLLFAPTVTAVNNLIREGIAEDQIHLVGDVMYDASLFYSAIASQKSNILNQLQLSSQNYLLATIHRAENTNDTTRLRAIFTALGRLDIPVILPLHPRTKFALEKEGLLEQVRNTLTLITPVGYLDMIQLEKNARLIVTDSGGIQKEAFFHRVPCITLREETEWVELVELGWNQLLPPHQENIIKNKIQTVLKSYSLPDTVPSIYGDGKAVAKIVSLLFSP